MSTFNRAIGRLAADLSMAGARIAPRSTGVAARSETDGALDANELNARPASMSQSLPGRPPRIDVPRAQPSGIQQAPRQTDSMARQGIAAAAAPTMLPQVEPGKTINVAAARFAGQSGIARGASAHVTNCGILKLGIGVSGQNKTFGAGYGYSW
ncbi:yadA-like C-terminal region family protein [Burkholderia thailandensis MSMB121]|uniref:YadA C-terminal domain-containing protein n=1 Tax=Burkholderia humptydooensis TaxID=430531 RepID=UPI000327FADD|nr:YadA C-terminal domain-containing protein [Burkholderia humptydooensis]AGK49848.1 yadA-like C-terminal region family protein [Burkholderia thailandensis MSMB121]ATF32470.1 hypothetical protein CO709_02995 [Burkholderia thailandensis]KST70562.1 cell surface protein [Burkholderia humptydooensis]